MTFKKRLESFSKLGEVLRNALEEKDDKNSAGLYELIKNQHLINEWFTPDNVKMALKAIAEELTFNNLTAWCSAYPQLTNQSDPINVGVVMAGNIPLVGFHDFLSVLISGNNIIAKTSSRDSELIRYVAELLYHIDSEFKNRIFITDEAMSGFDAVIATGSDNSSRYFEYYFGKYPNIIRKNRNSIAILDGTETEAELEALGSDIFSYFGLGCRNVSKIYIPKGYDFKGFDRSWRKYSGITGNNKYANNYDFNKAVYIVNKETFYDTGYLLLKEESGLSSPVSVLYYEYYDTQTTVIHQTDLLKEKIQCIVRRDNIAFGTAQKPHLWDYADGIDTIEFLIRKKNSRNIVN